MQVEDYKKVVKKYQMLQNIDKELESKDQQCHLKNKKIKLRINKFKQDNTGLQDVIVELESTKVKLTNYFNECSKMIQTYKTDKEKLVKENE